MRRPVGAFPHAAFQVAALAGIEDVELDFLRATRHHAREGALALDERSLDLAIAYAASAVDGRDGDVVVNIAGERALPRSRLGRQILLVELGHVLHECCPAHAQRREEEAEQHVGDAVGHGQRANAPGIVPTPDAVPIEANWDEAADDDGDCSARPAKVDELPATERPEPAQLQIKVAQEVADVDERDWKLKEHAACT